MKKSSAHRVNRRNDVFVDKTKTRIWCEQSLQGNPYIAEQVFCHGYEMCDLLENSRYVDVLYLLIKGELPDKQSSRLLEKLMIGLINPGPRHPATRAAMNAGVGKTLPVHILPIGAMAMGGERQCAGAIEDCMRFLCKNYSQSPECIADKWMSTPEDKRQPLYGFDQHYGGIHIQAQKLADTLLKVSEAADVLRWGNAFAAVLDSVSMGWLPVGVAAAVFVDLGLHPKYGAALFQLFSAPGMIAHGLVLYSKPLTAMPHVKDQDYEIEIS